ncbi:hypothetical protein FRC01_004969 [Tulasnella sp. 417]|nr:hypothetical protein FRC01_004969 [Tulasnella sp. 417]
MNALLAPAVSEKDVLNSNYLPVDGPRGTSSRTNTDDKAVPQSPLPQWSSRPGKHSLVGFLPTIIVLVITLGFVALIVGFILGTHYVPRQEKRGFGATFARGYFYLDEEKWTRRKSSEGHLGLLILSSLASHLITDTSSILMTLIAYRVGAQWLNASQENGSVAQNPTPLQYGLMVRLMGSSSISAIGESCLYAARSQARSRLPRLFKQALTMSVSVWILARLVGLADLWLHTTSKSVSVTISTPANPYAPYTFSAQFNQTICPAYEEMFNRSNSSPDPYPCAWAFDRFLMRDESMNAAGFYTMANESSSVWSTISLADAADLAILVPGPAIDTRNKSYTVSTFGIRANCASLNPSCDRNGTEITMTTSCAKAGYPQLPYFNKTSQGEVFSETTQIDDGIFGIVDGELLGEGEWEVSHNNFLTSNPAKVAIQLRWDTRNSGDATDFYGEGYWDAYSRAVDTWPPQKITLYAGCNVSFFDVTARRDGERNAWTLVDTRLMLGAASGYFETANATEVDSLAETLVGRYSVGPVLLFMLLLCLYALLALLVFLSSWWTADQTLVPPDGESADMQGTSMLALTQMWLTNPIPLVGGAFPEEDKRDEQYGERSLGEQDGRMIYNGRISDMRLGVGLTKEGFGIFKRPVGQKVMESDEP